MQLQHRLSIMTSRNQNHPTDSGIKAEKHDKTRSNSVKIRAYIRIAKIPDTIT